MSSASGNLPAQVTGPAVSAPVPGTGNQLTPSEQVVLCGQAFAPVEGRGEKYTMLGTQTVVSATGLGKAMFAAAILAAERAGEVRLEIRKESRLLGALKSDALYILPGDGQALWPAGSLEGAIKRQTLDLSNKKPIQVHRLVHLLMGKDYDRPWQGAVALAYRGLAGRDLVTTVVEKKLKVFTVQHYELPAATAALASAQDLSGVRSLLDGCRTARPEVWQLLMAQIESAVKSRQEKIDTSGPD